MIKLLEVDIPPTAAKLVTNAVNSGVLTKGKFNQVLAEDLAERHGFKYGVTCSNGTVAFELVRRIVPGIRTMVPSWTYHSPAHKFGDVIWVDVDPNTFQSEKEDYVKKAQDGKNHNVLRSYVYGGIPGSIPSDLLYVPGWNKGKLIDDASHILDTTKDDHQSSADFFVASMYATKPIASGEGGIILTNDQSAYDELLMYRDNHPNYGVNARLSEMNAALGYSYLAVCDERRAARNKIGDIYREAFGFDVVSVNDYLFPVNCDKKGLDIVALMAAMDGADIETTNRFYDSTTLHPRATGTMMSRMQGNVICLPIHHKMTEQDAMKVIDVFKTYVREQWNLD